MAIETTSNGEGRNNEYNEGFQKGGEAWEKSDGMGLEYAEPLKGFEQVAGTQGNERRSRLEREISRFEDLRAKAFGTDKPITNAGIVLDSFGGEDSESRERAVDKDRDEDTQGNEK